MPAALGSQGLFFVSSTAGRGVALGDVPPTDDAPMVGLTMWPGLMALAVSIALSLYLWPYVQRALSVIDVILSFFLMLTMAAHLLPPDLPFFSVAGAAPYFALSDIVVAVCFYGGLAACIVCIRFDMRGKGLEIPPWLRFLLFNMFKGRKGQKFLVRWRKLVDLLSKYERAVLQKMGNRGIATSVPASQVALQRNASLTPCRWAIWKSATTTDTCTLRRSR